VLLGIVSAVATLWSWGRSEPGRRVVDRAVLRLPLFGRLAVSLDMSRLCQNLGLLYSSGLPILASLSVTADIVQNRMIRDAVHAAHDRVQCGSTLVDALRPAGVVPAMVLRMLQVGESTGRLDESLARVALFYEREVPEVIQRALALFNSAVLVFLGSILVVIALSFFIPMYEALGNLNAR
jgi:type IV pilus assembly protein PilC